MSGQPDAMLQTGERSYALEELRLLQNEIPQLTQAMVVSRAHVEQYQKRSDLAGARDAYTELQNTRNRLANALGNAQLLLMEAEEYPLAANAGQLREGLMGFSLLSHVYRPVYDALNGFAAQLPVDGTTNAQVEYTRKQQMEQNRPNVVFIDFALAWIEKRKPEISPSTYRNYRHMVEHHMTNCFGDTPLRQISFWDIEDYYSYLEFNGLSSTTARHHHALLKCVFHEAHRLGIIQEDPTEFLKAPKRQPPKVSYYSLQEAQQLIEEVKGTKLEVPVTLSLAYGLRRSEALGLRWEDVDFEGNRIIVCHTVVEGIEEDGKRILVEKGTMKAKASRRTVLLFEPVTTMLKDEWERKKGLHPTFVCSDSNGQMMKPDVLSHDFKKFLGDHGLRHIRYQDLRHSCASLLLAAHVPLIQVQHWLGHGSMLTTANLYAHLDPSLVDECGEGIKKI